VFNTEHDITSSQHLADSIKNQLKEIIEWVKKNISQAQSMYKKYYDKKRSDPEYKVGDSILLKNRILSSKEDAVMQKLSPKWKGPFKVVKFISPLTFVIQDKEGKNLGVHHASNMKMYVDRIQNDDRSPSKATDSVKNSCNNRYPKRKTHIPGMYKY